MAYRIIITGFKRRADPYKFVVTYSGTKYLVTINPKDGIEDIGPAILDLLQTIAASINPVYTVNTAPTASVDASLDLYHLSMLGTPAVISPLQNGTEQFEVRALSQVSHGVQQLAQVEGIMSARGRLGAWTLDGKIHWSSVVDPMDFTPSISTQANELNIKSLLGNIITCIGYNNGFIIYATGNIVAATYQGGQEVFRFDPLIGKGIVNPKHAVANNDMQIVWTSEGLYIISPDNKQLQPVVPEITDRLAKYIIPTKIQLLNNRYIVLNLQDNPYKSLNNKDIIEGTGNEISAGNVPGSAITPQTTLEINPADTIAPNFPIYESALVFDMVLNKWGLANKLFKTLASINPINEGAYKTEQNNVDYHNELKGLVILTDTNDLALCNDNSADAYALFGNFRVSNRHLTQINGVVAEFTNYALDQIAVYGSSDGRLIDPSLNQVSPVNSSVGQNRINLTAVARWFNIAVMGRFHLKQLDIEAHKNGRD